MAKTINSDLIRGNINTIILKALYDGDRYGYDIIKEIEIKSHGQYILKQPTLYSCLKRLETQGFIEAYWGEQTSNGGRRKYYRLTDSGKEIFKQSQDEYEYSRTIIDNLISDNQYDLTTLAPLPSTTQENTQEIKEDEKEIVDTIVETNEIKEESLPTLIEETLIVARNGEQANSYNAPAPVFSEEKEEIAPIEQINNKVEENSISIDNNDYINSLLNQNSNSYFSRNNENENSSTQSTQANNDIDDLQKKLEEFKASFNKEMLECEKEPPNPTFITSTNIVPESYENGFYKYNTPHDGITSAEQKVTAKRSLTSLIQTSTINENKPNKTISIKEQIKTRNFGKLSQSIEELGESAKLRAHCDTKHEYKKQYYFRDSYLRLYHYAILFVILLVEVFAAYVAGKLLLNVNSAYDMYFYIGSIVAATLLPLSAAVIFLSSPNSRKRNDYNIKSSLIFRIIIMIQLILITYAVNVWMGMPITLDKNFFITLALPTIFAINFPFSAIVFNSLRKKSKFALKE